VAAKIDLKPITLIGLLKCQQDLPRRWVLVTCHNSKSFQITRRPRATPSSTRVMEAENQPSPTRRRGRGLSNLFHFLILGAAAASVVCGFSSPEAGFADAMLVAFPYNAEASAAASSLASVVPTASTTSTPPLTTRSSDKGTHVPAASPYIYSCL
jgi:hypothetical protein